ncbi:MAG: hypothetical protein IKD12_00170 [Paludibacteraceae bacterium]|nr:hypothetical protein [Paludibacteraceae bacterium]
MYTIISIWALLKPQGEYKRRRRVCERLWDSYDNEMQQRIYNRLAEALQRGERVNPNPYFAIEDTALYLQQKPPAQTLSYAEYYARYHTTEPRDGWRMKFLPDQQKTIYVKPN